MAGTFKGKIGADYKSEHRSPLRLKHIHIAGFKSFVDPVTLPATAQLTGIVGPNGCGKSNVIDAVRWVLGESKARELRGASMQDVIFNGSSGRKAASRASVELLFDNSDGKAAGQWAQYAEISVKRVLTRNGESSYFLNNVRVRRKDLGDLFLGTGLGGDAYAIIEQGMISRIIEAKPDELRGFLEEAAGVSKYKERRKETEARLRDTRDNLARVADIREELGRQLDKLAGQAEVARRFFAFDEERSLKTQCLALTRKRDAQARQTELNRQMEAAKNDIEAKLAELRHFESDLEAARLAQFEATEAVNQAQARFYTESGEVARIEQELRHLGSQRERLANELAATAARLAEAQDEQTSANAQAEHLHAELEQAEEHAAILEERAIAAGESLPESEGLWRESQAAVAEVQRELALVEQTIQLEAANREHAERAIEQLKAREARLLTEKDTLASSSDGGHLEAQQLELAEAQERLELMLEELETARAELPQLETDLRQARRALDEASRKLHQTEAELAALKKLQASATQAESGGAAWLERAGLKDSPRLWQLIRVEAGWESAVEAALGEAIGALPAEARADWLQKPPEGRFELALPALAAADQEFRLLGDEAGCRPLIELVQTDDARIARFLADRLALAYAADDLAQAMRLRGHLPAGGFIATRDGHRLGRDSLTFNAPEKGHHGLVARAREIERLEDAAIDIREQEEQARVAVSESEARLQTTRRQADALQAQLSQAQAATHALQVSVARAQEAARRLAERGEQVKRELDEIYEFMGTEEEAWNDAGDREREAQDSLDATRERLEAAKAQRQASEQRYQAVREAHRQVEREAQEAVFQVRQIRSRIADLTDRQARAERLQRELAETRARLEGELAASVEGPLRATLDAALARRQEAEIEMTRVRDALEGANAALRDLDAARMTAEHALDPLKDKLQALELKLQEARLAEERYAEELIEVDEAALAPKLDELLTGNRGDGWLKGEIDRLNREVEALGPVNMAALEELKAAEERKHYLDAQAEDLETAANTLEEAIRRIDGETRARLKDTYDKVSREFKSLFSELFGGGNAELILTGEEILDAGLTVVAQPPGKKNASIHLLSGGEKALTALSLVFAFFRLNPAPFCLLDEVDAPLDDSNTERYCNLVRKMSAETQFLFITHNRITMEMATHLVGVTMPEPGVSRPVAVDVDDAVRLAA
jgi:chromosome segregation protein